MLFNVQINYSILFYSVRGFEVCLHNKSFLDPCPEGGVDFDGTDLRWIENVPSWQACSNHCKDEADCSAFTYVKGNVVTENLRKNSYNVTSGSKRCIGN